MSNANKLSILLVSEHKDHLESLIRLVKRHFHSFYQAKTPEQAVEIIASKNINVVLFGFDSVQDAEVFYLHMIRADRSVEDRIDFTMLLCGKDQVQNAFNICNKDIFNDYFIVKPMYDPHHILLRLRTIRRLNANQSLKKTQALSVEELCSYFDQVASSGKNLLDLNHDTFDKLMTTVAFSMETMKERIRNEHPHTTAVTPDSVTHIIDDHAQNQLLPQLAEEKQHAEQDIDSLVSDLVTSSKNHKSSVQREQNQNAPGAISIMLLEDEATEMAHMTTILTAAGFQPHTATRATQALKMLDQWRPRIAIVDLTLPDMSALHVISRIKQHPSLQNTKIMALAKKGDKDKVMEAVKMGISEVMVKPVDKDLLMYKINYNLNR
ncbi:MAG: response regulator [Pontibacterium sp.]